MPSVDVIESSNISGKTASENKSIKVLDELMAQLTVSKSQDETNAATQHIATFINGAIGEADTPTK